MNYIKLINDFWALNCEFCFTPIETKLYFALLNTANKFGWKNNFNQSNSYLCLDCGISEPSLIKARNVLKEKKLIEFKTVVGRRNNTEYKIKYLNNFSKCDSIYFSKCDSISDSISDNESLDNIKLINKIKNKQEKIYKEKKFDFKKILIEQYGCEKQHVDDWGEVRKEKKAAVTKTVLKKIINECENNKFPVKEAIKICAERSWQGFNYDWVKNIRVEEKSREQRINEMKNRIL